MPLNAGLLEGKNALITGSRRGIGRAVVEIFAKNGANVWAFVREPDREFEQYLGCLAKKCEVEIRPVVCEMRDEVQMKEAFLSVKKSGKPVDILVNNAGTTVDALLPMVSMEQARELFDINFFSHLRLTQLVSRLMMRRREGCIVNIGSYLGLDGNRGQTIYSASKAAIHAMTKSLAKELGDYGIRVNAVAPGMVDTRLLETMSGEAYRRMIERISLHRPARPEEIASMVLVLASGLSTYVNGQIIRVDGGL